MSAVERFNFWVIFRVSIITLWIENMLNYVFKRWRGDFFQSICPDQYQVNQLLHKIFLFLIVTALRLIFIAKNLST